MYKFNVSWKHMKWWILTPSEKEKVKYKITVVARARIWNYAVWPRSDSTWYLMFVCNPITLRWKQEPQKFKVTLRYIVSQGKPEMYKNLSQTNNSEKIKYGSMAFLTIVPSSVSHHSLNNSIIMSDECISSYYALVLYYSVQAWLSFLTFHLRIQCQSILLNGKI